MTMMMTVQNYSWEKLKPDLRVLALVFVIGDSKVACVNEKHLSRKRIVKVRRHNSVTTHGMNDNLRPIPKRKPKYIILHISTN